MEVRLGRSIIWHRDVIESDDSDFDINLHVRHVALPKPGTERQLFDLATLLCADPFDRTRPLWQFTVVEGLKGNRAALIQKLHHTIADHVRLRPHGCSLDTCSIAVARF